MRKCNLLKTFLTVVVTATTIICTTSQATASSVNFGMKME